ncbi:MAG: right-handed parallel beta-helix repeat-containing protein [Acidimicrobiales bacterium]|nr:right-handed parallel beta-helix repeat-containing protein [Acidimicrobiales bacterium]
MHRSARRVQMVGVIMALLLAGGSLAACGEQGPTSGTPATAGTRYDIGSPRLTDVWLDPAHGDDRASGADRAHALGTMAAAWSRVPVDLAAAGTGVRILITPGTVPVESLPNNWYEGRRGTYEAPIVLQAADGPGTVTLQGGMNVLDVSYLYLVDLRLVAGGGEPAVTDTVLHGERVDHLLVRSSVLVGGRDDSHETVKVNQSSWVFIEDSDISGSYENPIDFVAVQHGHVIGNVIHDGGDWCLYVKGGSAHLLVDANEVHHCGTGGVSAGQGSGFEYLTSPWLHHEASGIEITNNVIHDTDGAGLGVNGGYNVLLAYNTLYRVGRRSHVIEVVLGSRGCDGDGDACRLHNEAGGWGPAAVADGAQVIPDRHVYVVNNLVVNPAGFRSEWQHLAVGAPVEAPVGWNLPAVVRADDDLVIAGNVIWNGPADLPLGVEDTGACTDTNPTCSAAQLRRDNAINTVQPELVDPEHGDYRLAAPVAVRTVPVPPVDWSDAPDRPDVRSLPAVRTDAVQHTRLGEPRDLPGQPGAS